MNRLVVALIAAFATTSASAQLFNPNPRAHGSLPAPGFIDPNPTTAQQYNSLPQVRGYVPPVLVPGQGVGGPPSLQTQHGTIHSVPIQTPNGVVYIQVRD